MKALSIRHPAINAILCGATTIQVRRHAIHHRGELLLHAARTFGPAERRHLKRLQAAGLPVADPAPEALGAIVGRATLAGCRPVANEDWERAFADRWEGPAWAWQLGDVERLEPIPMKGHLFLFEVEEGVVSIPR